MLAESQPRVRLYGDSALLIEWDAPPCEALFQCIQWVHQQVLQDASLAEKLIALVPAYQSLTLIFESPINTAGSITECVRKLAETPMPTRKPKGASKRWLIPVCYDASLAIDQAFYLKQTGLTEQQFIAMHSSVDYLIYFIGFLPGFLYLEGLDERLHLPRKASPSGSIPKGAVAIGGGQTGIYPQSSPGGWHVVGQTPVEYFVPTQQSPCFAKPGDRIRFTPIGLEEYEQLSGRLSAPQCEEVSN